MSPSPAHLASSSSDGNGNQGSSSAPMLDLPATVDLTQPNLKDFLQDVARTIRGMLHFSPVRPVHGPNVLSLVASHTEHVKGSRITAYAPHFNKAYRDWKTTNDSNMLATYDEKGQVLLQSLQSCGHEKHLLPWLKADFGRQLVSKLESVQVANEANVETLVIEQFDIAAKWASSAIWSRAIHGRIVKLSDIPGPDPDPEGQYLRAFPLTHRLLSVQNGSRNEFLRCKPDGTSNISPLLRRLVTEPLPLSINTSRHEAKTVAPLNRFEVKTLATFGPATAFGMAYTAGDPQWRAMKWCQRTGCKLALCHAVSHGTPHHVPENETIMKGNDKFMKANKLDARLLNADKLAFTPNAKGLEAAVTYLLRSFNESSNPTASPPVLAPAAVGAYDYTDRRGIVDVPAILKRVWEQYRVFTPPGGGRETRTASQKYMAEHLQFDDYFEGATHNNWQMYSQMVMFSSYHSLITCAEYTVFLHLKAPAASGDPWILEFSDLLPIWDPRFMTICMGYFATAIENETNITFKLELSENKHERPIGDDQAPGPKKRKLDDDAGGQDRKPGGSGGHGSSQPPSGGSSNSGGKPPPADDTEDEVFNAYGNLLQVAYRFQYGPLDTPGYVLADRVPETTQSDVHDSTADVSTVGDARGDLGSRQSDSSDSSGSEGTSSSLATYATKMTSAMGSDGKPRSVTDSPAPLTPVRAERVSKTSTSPGSTSHSPALSLSPGSPSSWAQQSNTWTAQGSPTRPGQLASPSNPSPKAVGPTTSTGPTRTQQASPPSPMRTPAGRPGQMPTDFRARQAPIGNDDPFVVAALPSPGVPARLPAAIPSFTMVFEKPLGKLDPNELPKVWFGQACAQGSPGSFPIVAKVADTDEGIDALEAEWKVISALQSRGQKKRSLGLFSGEDGFQMLVLRYFGETATDVSDVPMEQLQKELKAIHDAGVVHGDVALRNICMREGEVNLVDFGEAKVFDLPSGKARLDSHKASDLNRVSQLYGHGFA